MTSQYAYMWEFTVEPASIDRFIAFYGPGGDWVRLFSQAEGYIRTALHRDLNQPERFLTVDYWVSKADSTRFREKSAAQFEELDRMGEGLTVSERFLGDDSTLSS